MKPAHLAGLCYVRVGGGSAVEVILSLIRRAESGDNVGTPLRELHATYAQARHHHFLARRRRLQYLAKVCPDFAQPRP